MFIPISNSDPRPLYEQISEGVKEKIFKGDLSPGDALPSIRQLAQELKISVITIKRAYHELEQQKLIVTRQGRGTFVADYDTKEMENRYLFEIEQQIRTIITDAKKTKLPKRDLEKIFYKVLKEEY